MADLINEFAWSKSRAQHFAECRRLYWFQHYGKWGGWNPEAAPRTRELHILSKLQNRFMWLGDNVHKAVAEILNAHRRGAPPDIPDVLRRVWLRMSDELESSRSRRYRDPGMAKTCALREHEYELALDKDEWERLLARAQECLQNFVGSTVYGELKSMPADRWLVIDPPKPAAFDLDGVKVWIKIDAAHREGDGGIRIVDWKTGGSADEWAPVQLGVYALYAARAWEVESSRIRVAVCDLGSPGAPMETCSVEPVELESVRQFIRRDAAEMKGLLAPPAENRAEEDAFPGTDSPRACRSCNFLKECPVSPFKIQLGLSSYS